MMVSLLAKPSTALAPKPKPMGFVSVPQQRHMAVGQDTGTPRIPGIR